MSAGAEYLLKAKEIVGLIRETQLAAIERAAEICAASIATDGLVHVFGSGHSRIAVEEMFPRWGSFPGFHPIIELSLTSHPYAVGSNAQRQEMFLERTEGLAATILENFEFTPNDAMIVFSNSGVNAVPLEIGLGAKERDMPLIAVTSLEHSQKSEPKHFSGKRLAEIADVAIDNCAPAGDALVEITELDEPVGPGSTVGAVSVANALKSSVAAKLVERGRPPLVITSEVIVEPERAKELFDGALADYRRRTRRL